MLKFAMSFKLKFDSDGLEKAYASWWNTLPYSCD